MNGFGAATAATVEADGPQTGELFDDACQRAMPRCARRLACPGQHAHGRAIFGLQQRIESFGLWCGQAAGELTRDVPLRHEQCGCDQAFDD